MTLLSCPPKDKKEQLKIGIESLQAACGSVTSQCEMCHIPVWLGPNQKLMEGSVVCYRCIEEHYPDVEVTDIVGKGHIIT